MPDLDSSLLPALPPWERRHLLETLLKRVSRAFYLSMRILPGSVREVISIAYLLARAADTVADTTALAPETRLEYLRSLRRQLAGPVRCDCLRQIGESVVEGGAREEERALLLSLVPAFSLLASLDAEDGRAVRGIVDTLISGMEMDLTTFPPENGGAVLALPGAADLDRYTWLVAGCVGRFWTLVTARHIPQLGHWNVEAMACTGERLGKALQLVNVLRDLPGDVRMGRCYLPMDELQAQGLEPEDLADASSWPVLGPILARWVRIALGHFQAGEEYLLAIPRSCPRLRLAVLWPILIGLATLARLVRSPGVARGGRPVKVPRAWVYRVLLLSLPACFSDAWLRLWISRWRRSVEVGLETLTREGRR